MRAESNFLTKACFEVVFDSLETNCYKFQRFLTDPSVTYRDL